jgi:hypothetical protein
MYSSKNILGVYFVKYFKVKNGVFGVFKVNKCGKLAVCMPFSYISGGFGVLFDFFDSLHHHPRPGTPPANSRCTKQFLSHPLGLIYTYIYILYIIFYIIYVIYIYIGASDYGRGINLEPSSLLLVA